MGSLRIAIALPHLGVYGGIRRFLELGEVWTRRGHSVGIFTPEPEREPWLPFSGTIASLGALPLGSWDVILSPDPAVFLRARAPGALRVFYAVLERAPGERQAFRAADLVLANSAGMRRYLARRGVRAHDAAGGVNVAWFRPAEGRPAPTSGPVRVLVYGRVSRRRKGTWTAVRAVERASLHTGVPVVLTLFDAPPDGAGEPALPRALRIPHRWVLNPTQRALADLYRESDLFVSAERRAGWCNTAAEAMACGAAVACTRSGTEDFARNGVTARVARWSWAWLLSRRVAALLRDPAARAGMAARGHDAIQAYSWERTADRIERVIEPRRGGHTHGTTHAWAQARA